MNKEIIGVLILLAITIGSFFIEPWLGVAAISVSTFTFVLAMLKDWI